MNRILLSILMISSAMAEEVFMLMPGAAKLLSPAITEASGLAVSPASDDFLWIVNDSGGTPEIHLCETNGTARGAVRIEGVKNTDWEDLAAFRHKGENYLLIADTGDNTARRDSVFLLIVREPRLPSVGKMVAGEIPVAWKIDFTYEGGARDCEAVAVDARREKIILVSKRTNPPEVFELPLRPAAENPVAKRIGTTKTVSPVFSFIPHRNQPTGLDFSADGSSAVIVTYYGIFLFQKPQEKGWSEAFAAQPVRIGSHMLHQAESVAFAKNGRSILCVSEGKNSPIVVFTEGMAGR